MFPAVVMRYREQFFVETISFPEAALRKRVSARECELCSLNFVLLAQAQWNSVYYFFIYGDKQLLVEVFCYIRNNLGRCKCFYQPKLITLTETLIILDITKTESNNCFIILF